MTIQDILSDLGMSSGAFYHYFGSKPELLDALVEQIHQESEKPLLPVIHDHGLSTIEKLQGFFSTLDRLRLERKKAVIELAGVWYADDNAIVRQKVETAIIQWRAPLLTEIVRQGVKEGHFSLGYPEQAGEVVLSLVQGMGNAHARLMLLFTRDRDDRGFVENVVVMHSACMEAVERVLGALPYSLNRIGADAVREWVDALLENDP